MLPSTCQHTKHKKSLILKQESTQTQFHYTQKIESKHELTYTHMHTHLPSEQGQA